MWVVMTSIVLRGKVSRGQGVEFFKNQLIVEKILQAATEVKKEISPYLSLETSKP